jgi:hypothetical protein
VRLRKPATAADRNKEQLLAVAAGDADRSEALTCRRYAFRSGLDGEFSPYSR